MVARRDVSAVQFSSQAHFAGRKMKAGGRPPRLAASALLHENPLKMSATLWHARREVSTTSGAAADRLNNTCPHPGFGGDKLVALAACRRGKLGISQGPITEFGRGAGGTFSARGVVAGRESARIVALEGVREG